MPKNKKTTSPVAVQFLSGDSGRTYQIARVMQGKTPVVACTCPGFSRWKRCKHASVVLSTGNLPEGDAIILDQSAFDRRIAARPRPIPNTHKKENSPVKKNTGTKKTKPVVVEEPTVEKKKSKKSKVVSASLPVSTKKKETVVSEPAKKGKKKSASVPSFDFPVNVPVNVKVQGEKIMRKNVILVPNAAKPGFVQVRTGQRGRPANLDASLVVSARAL